MDKKVAVVIVITLTLIGLGYAAYISLKDRPTSIKSFEECKDAGYPIQYSNPPICRAGERSFIPEQ